jgi:hypothetical protein
MQKSIVLQRAPAVARGCSALQSVANMLLKYYYCTSATFNTSKHLCSYWHCADLPTAASCLRHRCILQVLELAELCACPPEAAAHG